MEKKIILSGQKELKNNSGAEAEKEKLARLIELRRAQRIARGHWREFPIVNRSKIVDIGGLKIYEPGADPMRDGMIEGYQSEVANWPSGLSEKLDKFFSSGNPIADDIDRIIDGDLGVKQA